MKIFSANNGLRLLFYSFVLASCPPAATVRAHASPPYSVGYYQQTISGTVSDASGPLPGTSVMVKGTVNSAVTDTNGNYSITAVSGDVLVFSFTGFKTTEVTIGSQSVINIILEEDSTHLEELTINAGYYSVTDKERTGSIARITAKDIETQPVTNVLATMQGRMAGVNITQTTGVPGGGFDITIRGQNSLRADGNSPLYVINGVPYDSTPIGNSTTSSTTPQPTSPLNSINPADIASIEVLKDADATAIYGSRGANGVVLITTKKGHEGKTRFTGAVSSGFGRVTRFLDLMDTGQYLQMRREAFANDGFTEYPQNAYDVNGTWDQNRYTNWQKELTGKMASFNTLQASLQGGSEQTQFMVSSNYSNQTTVFPGDFRYNKGNLQSSLNHTSLNNRFTISLTAGYTIQDNYLPPVDFTREAIKLAPNAPALYDSMGNLNWENNTFANPLASLEGDFTANTYDLIANTTLSYALLENLVAKVALGYTDLRHTEKQTLPSTMYNPSYGYGSEVSQVFVNTTNRNSWIIEPQLNYRLNFSKLKIDALAGATYQRRSDSQWVNMGYGFASNSLIDNPASASRYTVTSSYDNLYKYQAFFGRLNLNWDKRFLLNITGRRDGSSRFGPGNRFASFGAVGAAWIFSGEKWMQNLQPILSFGKIRASYGTTGNDRIGDYQYINTYTGSGLHYNGSTTLQPSRLFNSNFGWETNKKLELALETGFLNNRLNLTLAWFSNRSSSQLVGIPLPGTTGFSQIQANLGATVQNQGIEVTLQSTNIKNEKFSWTTSFNFSRLKNELVEFPGLDASTYRYMYDIGLPLNIVKMYHFTGVDPQTGMYTFEDANNDGLISAADDRISTVDLNPEFFGGVGNRLNWGPVELDFLVQFVKQKNFNQSFTSQMPGLMVNQPVDALNRWQQSGDMATYQQYSSGSNFEVQIANTRFAQSDAAISDASYLRLKNIALSVDLPQEWTGNARCRLSLQGQNLITITSFKGADPEFKTPGVLPPLRIFTTNLLVSF